MAWFEREVGGEGGQERVGEAREGAEVVDGMQFEAVAAMLIERLCLLETQVGMLCRQTHS